MGIGDVGNQRRFSGIGQPDQPDIGHQAQLQGNDLLLPLQPRLGVTRCLIDTGGVIAVPQSALAAARHLKAVAIPLQIRQKTAILTAEEGAYRARPDGGLVDSYMWRGAAPDTVFARFPDGEGDFETCDQPTPGALNGSSCGD